MNGRTYDPTLGRFLQADPHVQAPNNMQNYNRYSYVLNNPMSMTDPSGYFFKKLASFVKKYWKVAAMAAVAYYTGQWAQGLNLFAGNAVAAGAAAGAISGFITGAVTGAIFGALGGHIKGTEWNVGQQMLAHGMAGGVLQVLQGGKFGHGFVSAGIMKGVGKIQTAASWGRITIQAMAGGTVSRLTGGKFANGAMTATIQFVVNELTTGDFFKKLANDWNKMFARTKFDPVAKISAKYQVNGPAGRAASVDTEGKFEETTTAKVVELDAELINVNVEIQKNHTTGKMKTSLNIERSVGDDNAGALVKGTIDSDGELSATAQANLMNHQVEITGTVMPVNAVNNAQKTLEINRKSFDNAANPYGNF